MKKSRAGNEYRVPQKYDHFVLTTLHRDAGGRLIEDAALMHSLRGSADPDGHLRALPIALLSNDIEEVLQAAYLWYDGKRLAAKSDGETLTAYCDTKSGTWLDVPKTMPWKPEYADIKDAKGNARFKLHCTLNVVVVSPEAKWGGFYKFRTTSRITSDQLYGSLVQLRQLTGGILRGLPLRLVVRPLQVSPNGQPTTVYVVHVELSGSDVTAIQNRALEIAQHEVSNAKQLAAAQAEYRQLLRGPDEFLDADEEGEIAQEFAPHQQPGVLPAVTVHASPVMPDNQPRPAVVEDGHPADPEPDHPDAWEDADTRLSDACERVGTSPADALRLHAAALGRTGSPRVTDLTTEELRRLTAMVEGTQAPGGGTLFTPGAKKVGLPD